MLRDLKSSVVLRSVESIDSDFGDLENLSLDDVDLDEDGQEKPAQSPATPAAPAPINDVAPTEPGKDAGKDRMD